MSDWPVAYRNDAARSNGSGTRLSNGGAGGQKGGGLGTGLFSSPQRFTGARVPSGELTDLFISGRVRDAMSEAEKLSKARRLFNRYAWFVRLVAETATANYRNVVPFPIMPGDLSQIGYAQFFGSCGPGGVVVDAPSTCPPGHVNYNETVWWQSIANAMMFPSTVYDNAVTGWTDPGPPFEPYFVTQRGARWDTVSGRDLNYRPMADLGPVSDFWRLPKRDWDFNPALQPKPQPTPIAAIPARDAVEAVHPFPNTERGPGPSSAGSPLIPFYRPTVPKGK